MIRHPVSRRAVVVAGMAGALAVAARAAAQGAPDASALRFRSIVVDTSPVAERGSSKTAAALQQVIAHEAREIFADRITPSDMRAPQLVLRVNSIQLAAYAGGDNVFDPGEANTDYLDGVGLVMSGGRVLSTTPVLSALDASYSGTWYLPDIDQRRVASIGHHFVYWMRRQMGL